MLAELLTGSGKSVPPSIQAGLTPEQTIKHKKKVVQQPVKRVNLSKPEELAADVQKNLNIMNYVDLRFLVHKASGQIRFKCESTN
jgi:hypothetical protein